MKWTNSLTGTPVKMHTRRVRLYEWAVYTKEIKSMINNLSKQKEPGLNEFTGKLYQTFKEEIIPILYNLFQKIEAEEILPNLFFEANITLVPKPEKDITRKEN